MFSGSFVENDLQLSCTFVSRDVCVSLLLCAKKCVYVCMYCVCMVHTCAYVCIYSMCMVYVCVVSLLCDEMCVCLYLLHNDSAPTICSYRYIPETKKKSKEKTCEKGLCVRANSPGVALDMIILMKGSFVLTLFEILKVNFFIFF